MVNPGSFDATISESLVISKIDDSIANIDVLLQLAVSRISQFIEADRTTLFLFDETTNELWSKVTEGSEKDGLKEIRVKLGEGIAGTVMATGETLDISDAYNDKRFYRKIDEISGYTTKMIHSRPLVNTQGKRIGVIEIINKKSGKFSDKDEQILDALCSQAVVAIENAQLYQHVQKRREYEHRLNAELRKKHRELQKAYREVEDSKRNLENLMIELEESNRTLEGKVQERTQSLLEKNDILEQTLGSLTRAQDQLVTQEKLASLGALTAGIAHEIKNPLNFVNNFARISAELTEELDVELDTIAAVAPDAVAQTVRQLISNLRANSLKITAHGQRADSIVRGMLAHSHDTKGEKEATDLNALVEEYANLVYHGKRAENATFNVRIRCECDENLQRILIFRQDLGRVLLNILNNACYATSEKDRNAGPDYQPEVVITTKDRGKMVEIRIRDNGTGIPEHVQTKILDPFFTTKPTGAGTGLGLSISNEIVTKVHKGSLTFKTKPGEFTEWTILLPKDPD